MKEVKKGTNWTNNLELLLEFSPDAIVVANNKGVIEMLNEQTEKLFGYTQEELIGSKIEILMPARYSKSHVSHRKNYYSHPHARPMGSGLKLFGLRKNGTEFPIEISLKPVDDKGLVAAAIRDITDRFLLENLVNKNRQLEDFAYITSHNLRAPVSNLIALIDFYKIETFTDQKEFLFSKIEETSLKLQDTLNNLMEVLVIKQDLKQTKTQIKFKDVFDKVIPMFETEINTKGAKISCDFEEVPEVQYSKIYLESIFFNLISNSLKYSSTKRIPVIQLKTKLVDGRVEFFIKDNGLGMDLNKVGSKLFGLNKVFHKHPEAKGVGLFITKAQVEAMGGIINVKSQVEKGCTFTIIF